MIIFSDISVGFKRDLNRRLYIQTKGKTYNYGRMDALKSQVIDGQTGEHESGSTNA